MTKDRHMSPSEVEGYSLGTIAETDLAPLEEHLLICDHCRSLVEESDSYIRAVRAAASEQMKSEEPERKEQAAKKASFKPS